MIYPDTHMPQSLMFFSLRLNESRESFCRSATVTTTTSTLFYKTMVSSLDAKMPCGSDSSMSACKSFLTDNRGDQKPVEINGEKLRMRNYCNNGYNFFSGTIMPEDAISSRGITFCISFKNFFFILANK